MKRGGPLKRSAAPKRSKGVRKRNPERRASEFARCYGSEARVAAMKMRPCDACGWPPDMIAYNDCAHVKGGGAGRKAGWQETLTLCRFCHRKFHEVGSVQAFDRAMGTDLRAVAARLAVEITP